jgi:rhodanese-related sulfurtransferase
MKLDKTEIRIDVDQARAKLEAGEAVALDVVQPGAWDGIDGVVKGAVRIPPEEIPERFKELPRELDVVAYCT